MGARQKLNQFHFATVLVLSTIAGAVCQSWVVFFLSAVGLLLFAMKNQEIRLNQRRR